MTTIFIALTTIFMHVEQIPYDTSLYQISDLMQIINRTMTNLLAQHT